MTQSFQQTYSRYGWIKVPGYKDDPQLPWEQRYERLQQHHVAETTFLIEEVRKLARRLDELQSAKDET